MALWGVFTENDEMILNMMLMLMMMVVGD